MEKKIVILISLAVFSGVLFAENPLEIPLISDLDDIEIIGSWSGQLMYAYSGDEDMTFTITNNSALVDWADVNAGDVRFDVTQYDNSIGRAILKITDNPDVPAQVGMYLKIIWSLVSSDEIMITWYGLYSNEADAIAGTGLIAGPYPYTRITVDVHSPSFTEETFQLFQNYPNPFNPSTIITYSIHKPDFVTLKIYNSCGRELQTLINEFQDDGIYTVEFNASGLASGTYYYRLKIGNFLLPTKKMLYVN